MNKKNYFILICLGALFLSINGCAAKSYERLQIERDYDSFNSIDLDNKSIIITIVNKKNDNDLTDSLVNKIKNKFKENFKNVNIVNTYNDIRQNEIIIVPSSIYIESSKTQAYYGQGSLVKISSNIKVKTYYSENNYEIEGLGLYEQNLAATIPQQILGVATLFTYTRAQSSIIESIAKSSAVDHIACQLVESVVSDDAFSEFVQINDLPSQLNVSVNFSDYNSFSPNKRIDAGEKSTINLNVENVGKGPAYAVQVAIDINIADITTPKSLFVGDIPPGEKKVIAIPISAGLGVLGGGAVFTIKVREKRGYDSRPIKLKIETASLQRPNLKIISYEFNDTSGLSRGNGDSQLDNNETIELIPLVKNIGDGPAFGVKIGIKDISEGIEIVRGEDSFSTVNRNDLRKAKLAFKIPRTYSQPSIEYTLYTLDARGIMTENKYSIPFRASTPVLGFTHKIVTFSDNDHEVFKLENGKSYLLKISPKNSGNNPAVGVKLNLASSSGVQFEDYPQSIGTLNTNQPERVISIPFTIERSYAVDSVKFKVELSQDDFPKLTKTVILPVFINRSVLECETVLLGRSNGSDIMQNTSPTFRVSVRNKGNLDAENVTIHFKVSHPTISFEKTEHIGRVTSGSVQYRDFSFFVRGDTDLSDLSIIARINQADFNGTEKHLTVHVVPQTAIVQTVVATGAGKISSAMTYSQPPQISVNFPNDQDETYSKIIKFKGNILLSGIGNGIGKVSVTVNGQPVQIVPYIENIRPKAGRLTQQKVGNKILLEGQIALDPDSNRIEIKCVDWNNQDQTEVVNVVRKARLGDIYAVVVGVSQFSNKDLDLNYAATDAQKFYDFLKTDMGGKVSPDRMKLLINSQASRASVTKALTRFLGMAEPEDTVEIYLATHGYIDYDGTLYYLTHDSEMENLLGTALSSVDFENIIRKKIQADRVIIYIDTCKAGQAGQSDLYVRGGGLGEVNQANSRLAARLSNFERGVATFMATSAQGYSYEAQQWDGGVYTYHLLKGLKGDANDNGDEWVSIGELAHYLTSEVYADTSGKQRPNMDTRLPDDTPVAQIHE